MTVKVQTHNTKEGHPKSRPSAPDAAAEANPKDQARNSVPPTPGKESIDHNVERELEDVNYIGVPKDLSEKLDSERNLKQQRLEHGLVKVTPFSMDLPLSWTSGNIEELFELLNKSETR